MQLRRADIGAATEERSSFDRTLTQVLPADDRDA